LEIHKMSKKFSSGKLSSQGSSVIQTKSSDSKRPDRGHRQAQPAKTGKYIWPKAEGKDYFPKLAKEFIQKHEDFYKQEKSSLNSRNLTIVEFVISDADGRNPTTHLLMGVSGQTNTNKSSQRATAAEKKNHKLTKENRIKMAVEMGIFETKTIPEFLSAVECPEGVDNIHILSTYNKTTEQSLGMNSKLLKYWACSEPKLAAELGRFALLAKSIGKKMTIICSENYSFSQNSAGWQLTKMQKLPSPEELKDKKMDKTYIRVLSKDKETKDNELYQNTQKKLTHMRVNLGKFDLAMQHKMIGYRNYKKLSENEVVQIETLAGWCDDSKVQYTKLGSPIKEQHACGTCLEHRDEMERVSKPSNEGDRLYYTDTYQSRKTNIYDFQCKSLKEERIGDYVFTRKKVDRRPKTTQQVDRRPETTQQADRRPETTQQVDRRTKMTQQGETKKHTLDKSENDWNWESGKLAEWGPIPSSPPVSPEPEPRFNSFLSGLPKIEQHTQFTSLPSAPKLTSTPFTASFTNTSTPVPKITSTSSTSVLPKTETPSIPLKKPTYSSLWSRNPSVNSTTTTTTTAAPIAPKKTYIRSATTTPLISGSTSSGSDRYSQNRHTFHNKHKGTRAASSTSAPTQVGRKSGQQNLNLNKTS
jgi:hypothetical protein